MSLDELAKRESLSPYQDRLSVVERQLKKIEHQMTLNNNERLRQIAIIRESVYILSQEEGLKQWIKRALSAKEESNDT